MKFESIDDLFETLRMDSGYVHHGTEMENTSMFITGMGETDMFIAQGPRGYHAYSYSKQSRKWSPVTGEETPDDLRFVLQLASRAGWNALPVEES